MKIIGLIFLALALSACGANTQGLNFENQPQQNQGQVIFNDVPVKPQQMNQFQGLASGRYWYDSVSGLWGMEGGPSLGQMYPGLSLGVMRSDASVAPGTTNVFINGRELHPQEVYFLQSLYGSVIPGRYWLDANGNGGFEGGPAIYNLGAAIAHGMGRGGSSSGGGRLGHSVTGSVIGGGGTVGYIDSHGTGITCGPDGGCF